MRFRLEIFRSMLAHANLSSQVAANLDLTPKAVRLIGGRYQQRGLEQALYDGQSLGKRRIPELATLQRESRA
jgi:hypothetical protein